jgi:hypothetical protein
MDLDSEEQSSERAELHFLAALVDELMKAMLVKGVMDRREPDPAMRCIRLDADRIPYRATFPGLRGAA